MYHCAFCLKEVKSCAFLLHQPSWLCLRTTCASITVNILHWTSPGRSNLIVSTIYNMIAFQSKSEPPANAFSYAWSLLVMWQRWWSHHSICHSRKPMLHANFTALCSIEPELLLIEVYIAGIGIFDLFGSGLWLDLDPMIFIYELDLYPLEMYQISENERSASRLP